MSIPIRRRFVRTPRAPRVCGALALVLLAASTGCRTPEPATRADVLLPDSFSESGGRRLEGAWWTSLGDSALDALIAQALRDNPSLDVVAARLRRAQAVARLVGADREVQLDGTATIDRAVQRREEQGPGGASRETDSSSAYGLGLAASYELDLWGRLEASEDAAQLDAEAAAEDLDAARITLSAEVGRAWYSVVEARGQLGLLDGQLQTNQQVLELLEMRFAQGSADAADVLQQRQLVESVRGDRVEVASDLALASHTLAVLLGTAPGLEAAPDGAVLPTLAELPRTGVPADLLQARPDLRAAMQRLRAADGRVAAAVAESYPRVFLTLGADTLVDHPGDLFHEWLARLAGSLVAPLLDGGSREAQTDVQRAERDEALHQYREAVLVAVAEVEDALAIERHQAELIASLDRQVVLARQVIERVRDTYASSGDDFLRVLTAVLSEQNLERRRLAASRTRVEARIALHRSLATALPVDAAADPVPEPVSYDDSSQGLSGPR